MRKVLFIGLFTSFAAYGQETITLQQCIDLVKSNSLLTIEENREQQAGILERRLHYFSYLPGVNSTVGMNTFFGRRVDPFTNTFSTSLVNSQSLGMTAEITVFNGFKTHFGRYIKDLNVQHYQTQLDNRQNEQILRVIALYSELCKQEIQITYSRLRIRKYDEIHQIQKKLIEAGKITAIDTLKSHNSALQESLLLVQLESAFDVNLLEMNYLTGLELRSRHHFDLTSVSSVVTLPVLAEKFALDELTLAQQLSEKQIAAERSAILPTLTISGSLGTGFSTNNKDYQLAGNPTKPFDDQIRQNLFEGVGLYLRIPIFNRGEWVKTKQLHQIQRTALQETVALKQRELEKRQLEQEQLLLSKAAALEQSKLIVQNLETMYTKTVLLYQEGKISYLEVDTAFLEWQMKLVGLEMLAVEYEQLKLIHS